MEIYVGYLTASDTVSDLKRFFKGYDKKARFQIVKLLRESGPLYYGLVDIESERLARKALKKLNAAKLNGHRVCVREYEHRSGCNERRALNWRSLAWDHPERRLTERREKSRRKSHDTEDELEFTGYDNMSVKHFSTR